MARAAMCPPPPRPSARTTVSRDACRRRSRSLFLRRGGRPRRSTWWRAWLARLLPTSGGSALVPPAPVSASLGHGTEILTITFDRDIDAGATTAAASQFSISDGAESFVGVSYAGITSGSVMIQFNLPGAIPLEMTCGLSPGPGAVVGMNGAPAAPFSGMPVVIN